MKQFDALIISALALAWLCGALAAYFWMTINDAIRRYEKRQKEVPGEITDPFEDIDLTVINSEQPYVC